MIIKGDIFHSQVCNFNDMYYPYLLETFQEEPFLEHIGYLQKENINSPPSLINTDNIESMEELIKFTKQLIRKEKIKKINESKTISRD
jgi:hypothetical protein